jgi:hypothetical protein
MKEQKQDRCSDTTTDRRTVLKGTGGVATAFGLNVGSVNLASAATSDYFLGETIFVETKIEYKNVTTSPLLQVTNLANYVVDEKNNYLTLTNAPIKKFEDSDLVVTNGSSFVRGGNKLPAQQSERLATLSADYRRLEHRSISLEEPMTVPKLTVNGNGDFATVQFNGDAAAVHTGEEQTIQLGSTPVTVLNEPGEASSDSNETVYSARPRITIRNHGRLPVYGAQNSRVLPLNSDDPYAKARVHSVLNVTPEEAEKATGADLVVIEEQQEMTKDRREKEAESANGGR